MEALFQMISEQIWSHPGLFLLRSLNKHVLPNWKYLHEECLAMKKLGLCDSHLPSETPLALMEFVWISSRMLMKVLLDIVPSILLFSDSGWVIFCSLRQKLNFFFTAFRPIKASLFCTVSCQKDSCLQKWIRIGSNEELLAVEPAVWSGFILIVSQWLRCSPVWYDGLLSCHWAEQLRRNNGRWLGVNAASLTSLGGLA